MPHCAPQFASYTRFAELYPLQSSHSHCLATTPASHATSAHAMHIKVELAQRAATYDATTAFALPSPLSSLSADPCLLVSAAARRFCKLALDRLRKCTLHSQRRCHHVC